MQAGKLLDGRERIVSSGRSRTSGGLLRGSRGSGLRGCMIRPNHRQIRKPHHAELAGEGQGLVPTLLLGYA